MINILRKNRFIFLILAVACLFSFLVMWAIGRNQPEVSGSYQPSLASEFSLVLGSDDFSEESLKEKYLENISNEGSVVLDPNNLKSAQALLPFAGEVYVHLFDSKKDQGEISATTSWIFSRPFNFATYVSENSFARIIYQPKDKTLSFVITGSKLLINGKEFKVADVVLEVINDVETDSLIKLGDRIINLAIYQNDETIKVGDLSNVEFVEYYSDRKNALASQNYSFEQGLWQDQVSDCSAYLPGEANIGMSIESQASDGSLALSLTSANHHACTLNSFNVDINDNNLYLLSINYLLKSGSTVQAYYNMKNDLGKNQEEFISIKTNQNQSWQSIDKVINPNILSPDLLEVYLYAPSDGSETIDVLYDNIRLLEYSEKRRIKIKEDFIGKKILDQNLDLSEVSSFSAITSADNLLESYNYSFEQGLWQAEVGNCSDYLKGDPRISMRVNPEKSEGSQSLELSSGNHYACTFSSFPISLNADNLYELSFDYKNISGDVVQYYFNAPINGVNQEYFRNFDTQNNDWSSEHLNIELKIADAKKFDFYLYAPSEGDKHVVNLFDNVKLLNKGPKDIFNYFLFSKNDLAILDNQGIIEYNKINSRQTMVVLHQVTKPLVLVYPKKYSPKTSLYFLPTNTKSGLSQALTSAGEYYFEEDDKNGIISRQEVESLLPAKVLSEIGNQEVVKLGENIFYNNNLSEPTMTNWFWKDRISEEYSSVTHSEYHAWLINPVDFCSKKNYCVANEDGSYSMILLIEDRKYAIVFWLKVLAAMMFFASLILYRILAEKKK